MRSNAPLILNPLSQINEQSMAIHRALGNKRDIAHSRSQWAQVCFVSQADQARVSPLLEECLALSLQVGFKEGIAASYSVSGQVALSQGGLAAARSLAEKSVALYRERGHRHGTANSLSLFSQSYLFSFGLVANNSMLPHSSHRWNSTRSHQLVHVQ